MQKGLAIFAFALLALPCFAQQAPTALPSWNDAAQKAWWTQNPTPDLWPKAADALQAQLEANYQENGARSFSDSDFQGWLDQLEWIRLAIDCPDVLADPNNLKTFVALGQDGTVSHLFVEKLTGFDDKKEALKNLLRLAQANSDDLHEYAALGVAYALVWDQPFPRDWPHSQVHRDAVPIGDLDFVKRFQFYVQANRDKKLENDLTQLSFDNLKFLVDSEVSLSELQWAQGPPDRTSYSSFGDAFFAIKYDDNRVNDTGASVYVWPHPTYRLSDILALGGICIDQAYYAETLGKGRGIPTIRFTGLGVDGAHAWFGYLTSSGKWELDCGRYENQSFPKGFAIDPQTWQRIDDSVLENFFKNGATNPAYQPEMFALAWAQLHFDGAAYAHILDDARSVMPEWSGTWRLQAALVDKSGDLDKIKAFYQDWVNQFGNYPDLKVEGQKRLYLALKAANDPDADQLLKDIILQNRSEGFDLGIAADAEAIQAKIKAGDWDGARTTYETAIRDFGQDGGLTLFSQIIYPYVTTCLQGNQVDQADQAITFTQDRMTLNPGTQVAQDFAQLKDKVASAAGKAASR